MRTLEITAIELSNLTAEYYTKMNLAADPEFSIKSSPEKWSKKQIVGHLVDSAQNNLCRFITGQYEFEPPFLGSCK